MQVVNGNERGGPLNRIKKVDERKLACLDPNYHVYLDNLSGDYYTYDPESQEWKPRGNTGLHQTSAEASLQGELVKGPSDLLKKVVQHENKYDD